MSSNSDLQIENINIDDIESQNVINKHIVSHLEVPLKGILRDPNQNIIDEKLVEIRLLKICISLLIIIIMAPIIVSDLYFGFSDTSCSREQPDELEINLRLYLLVSGFTSLSTMILLIFGACMFSEERVYIIYCGSAVMLALVMFNLIWNILGAIVFWAYIYENGSCNISFSTYMFVSLIIKFCGTLFSYQLNSKKNDDK